MVQVAPIFRGRWTHAWVTLAMRGVVAISVALVACVFALVDPVLWRPLPYRDPDALIAIRIRGYESSPRAAAATIVAFREWQSRTDLFESLAQFRSGAPVRFVAPAGPVVLRTIDVSPSFFDVLGGVVHGRTSAAIQQVDEIRLTLPHHIARRLTATAKTGVQHLVGTTFVGPEQRVTIAAILEPAFVLPDAYAPLSAQAVRLRRDDWPLDSSTVVVARRRSGVSLSDIAHTLSEVLSVSEGTIEVVSLRERVIGRTRRVASWAVVGTGVLGLASLASMFTLLGAANGLRRDEFMIRASLGASVQTMRLMVMLELAVVTAPATLVGLCIGAVALLLVGSYIPEPLLLFGVPTLSLRAIVAGVGTVVALVASAGLLAALALPTSRDGYHVRSATRGLRATAIVIQSAVACLLMVGAGLLVRSSATLLSRETGLDRASILVTVSYSAGGSALQQEIDEVIRRLAAVPGVRGAGASVGAMLDRMVFPGAFVFEGKSISGIYKRVTPAYFDAAGATLIAGRPFTSSDTVDRGALINETMARLLGDVRAVVGRTLGSGIKREILGVVKDELNVSLDQASVPTVYLLMKNPWDGCHGAGCGQVTYVIAPTGGSSGIRALAPRLIGSARLNPALLSVASIDELLKATIRDRLFAAGILAALAAFAVALSVTSLVALLALAITNRRREMAVRQALGAPPTRIVLGLVSEPLMCVALGIVIGLMSASLADHLVEHLVYGITTGDIKSRVTAVATVLLVCSLTIAVFVRCLSSRRLSEALRAP